MTSRKRSTETRRRNVIAQLRLDDTEEARILRATEALGVTRSALMRRAIEDYLTSVEQEARAS